MSTLRERIDASKERLENDFVRLFQFRLMAKLGCATIEELMRRIGKDGLVEWMAFNEIDPFTEDRADYRSAILGKILATAFLEGHYSTNDFMAVPEPVEEMSFEEMTAVLRGTVSQ